MKNNFSKVFAVFSMVALSGCVTIGNTRAASGPATPMAPTPGMVQPQAASPNAGYQVAGPGGYMPLGMNQNLQMLHSQVMSEVSTMKQRLERVERAMIRLDRRMQLVEHNELSRMSSNGQEGGATLQPMSFMEEGAAIKNMLTPVSHMPTGEFISSSLQPASRGFAGGHGPVNEKKALPSLADEEDKNSLDTQVDTWMVSYDDLKIWPSRSQLPSSRDVVDSLRSKGPVAVFARGNNTASRQFRERVKALSRYLSRVGNRDKVAITALPAEYLEEDTIEIMVTR